MLLLANAAFVKDASLNEFKVAYRSNVNDTVDVYCRSLCQALKYVDTYTGFDVLVEDAGGHVAIAHDKKGKMLMRRLEAKAYRPAYHSKRQYVNMIRAQLSQAERQLLFMACLVSDDGVLKFYVEKYSLLKGVVLINALTEKKTRFYYSYLAFADYEDIDIYHLMLLDANRERASQRKTLQLSRSKSVAEVIDKARS